MKDTINHNFWELSNFNKVIYLLFIRPFQSKKERVFFDGSFFLPGQMYKAERKAIYEIVRETQPDYCFEIGTYTGGGSTFFISKALRDNGKGKLFTTENDQFLYNKAKKRYQKYIKSQYSFIEFIYSSSPIVFEKYLKEKDKAYIVLLDGAEDGGQTLEQYNYFLPYFRKGTILMIHDWNTEKTRLIKPVILNNDRWKIITEIKPPSSVGFIIVEML